MEEERSLGDRPFRRDFECGRYAESVLAEAFVRLLAESGLQQDSVQGSGKYHLSLEESHERIQTSSELFTSEFATSGQ